MRATFYGMTEKVTHELETFARMSHFNLRIQSNEDCELNNDVVISTESSNVVISSSFKSDIVSIISFSDKGCLSMPIDTTDFERLVII